MKNFLFVAIAFLFISCDEAILLEMDNVVNFEVQEVTSEEGNTITISGLCASSAYVVKDIEVMKKGDVYCVGIIISPFKKENESGSFMYNIDIPFDVNHVVLGKLQTKIWKREENELFEIFE